MQRCPRCGSETAYREQGLSVAWGCRRCGWGVATTNAQHPLFDRTPYDLYVEAGVPDRKRAIATAAAVLGANLPWTRTRIDAGKPLVEGVSIAEAASLQRRLADAGLRVRVHPALPVPLAQIDAMVNPGPTDVTQPRPRPRSGGAAASCEICGKPGEPRAHPSAPATTMILCDEHADSQSSFNPISLLMQLILLAVVAGSLWLAYRWFW